MKARKDAHEMQPNVYYLLSNATPDYDALMEQSEYLNGVLWSDKAHRMDMDSDRDVGKEIDRYGSCSRHFWRGVLDAGGYVSMKESRTGTANPLVHLNGSYCFLAKFHQHLVEELGKPLVDPEGKLLFQCSANKMMMSGALAKAVIVHLYAGARVTATSNQFKADLCMTWTPRR